MNFDNHKKISEELSILNKQVEAVAKLLESGATVPFIARYRKEATNSLNEVIITQIRDRLEQLADLDKRRAAILKSLDERELLSEELESTICSAETMVELEDIYLPLRPKRRTKATAAREKGLEPLAKKLYEQGQFDILSEAEKFIEQEKDVNSIDEALSGARDIIAEWINENATIREEMRSLFSCRATLQSKLQKGKEDEGNKFKDYFDWSEISAKAPGHRILAILRGETLGILSVKIKPSEDEALRLLNRNLIKRETASSLQVKISLEDSYKRLLAPSMETELRKTLKEKADDEAIRVFTENLRELLLAAPLGEKKVMALDPGFRTGAKLVCLDSHGQLLHFENIFPTNGGQQGKNAEKIITSLCKKYKIEAVAIGNGTAGRETETFIKKIDLSDDIIIVMVNESGASIYSASEIARNEFPDHDITVRGAVSIGRRLMDPLAELVKIDPKSIGVGQYQHDVDQNKLKKALGDTVISCVNMVGVEVNTASKELLSYVSGLGPALAENIISYRNTNGTIKSRSELKKVKRLGANAFQQSAGFLRIADAKNPLDSAAVHPESYPIVKKMASDSGISVKELIDNSTLRKSLRLEDYVTETIGLPTLIDIMKELDKPGRDPREKFEKFEFADGINSINDLKEGMNLPGIITNVTKFGAFVDIGVHQDGLVHISQLADRFISNPADIVKVNQKVMVRVLDVDSNRKRISLTMKI